MGRWAALQAEDPVHFICWGTLGYVSSQKCDWTKLNCNIDIFYMKFFIKVFPHRTEILCTVRHVMQSNNKKPVESCSLAVERETRSMYHSLICCSEPSVYRILSCSEAKLRLAQTSSPYSEWLPPVLLGIWSRLQTASVNWGRDYTGHGATHCSALVNLVTVHNHSLL